MGTSRTDRSTEFGFIHALPALVLMVALFFGGDWAADAKEEVDASRLEHGRAVMLALNGSNAAAELDFDELEPTDGFVAPSPKLLRAVFGDDPVASGPEYELEVRITNLDPRGSLRRVELRVGYETVSGDRASVAMATTRNDWTTSTADRGRRANGNGA